MYKSFLFLALSTIVMSSAFASSHIEDLRPGYCSRMSKNPICWERPNNPHIPAKICPSSSLCTSIEKVTETTGRRAKAQFTCSDSQENSFDCSEIVDLYGKNIEGLIVKVSTNFYPVSHPGCHVIGGCQRCVEGMSFAEISHDCQ